MKVGILSDSHGKSHRLAKALAELTDRRAEIIVHCGDVSGVKGIEQLSCAGKAYMVAGNMDRHIENLAAAAEKWGIGYACEVIEIPLGNGKRLAATHGNDEQVLGQLISDQRFDYVCHGHTHRRRDEKIGRTRVINPGALHHPRQPNWPSAAVLDTETDSLEWVDMDL